MGQRPKISLLDLKKFSKCKHATYQIYYDRMFDRCFDNQKIANYIDLDDFCAVEFGLKSCLESFLKAPQFKKINWQSEAIKDRMSGEVATLSEIDSFKQKMKYLIYRFFHN